MSYDRRYDRPYEPYPDNYGGPPPIGGPQTQPVTVFGRVVQNPEEIAPGEIPMDGRVCLFPNQDYSKIYARMWNAQGVLVPQTYIAENQDDVLNAIYAINNRLDSIDKKLSERKPYQNQKYQRNNQNPQAKEEG